MTSAIHFFKVVVFYIIAFVFAMIWCKSQFHEFQADVEGNLQENTMSIYNSCHSTHCVEDSLMTLIDKMSIHKYGVFLSTASFYICKQKWLCFLFTLVVIIKQYLHFRDVHYSRICYPNLRKTQVQSVAIPKSLQHSPARFQMCCSLWDMLRME